MALGPQAVVVTGGVDGLDRVDVLADAGGATELRGPTIATGNDHGTGCTFAAAATAALARGIDLTQAVGLAHTFVRAALTESAPWHLGRGAGPVSHLSPVHPPTTASHTTDPRRNP